MHEVLEKALNLKRAKGWLFRNDIPNSFWDDISEESKVLVLSVINEYLHEDDKISKVEDTGFWFTMAFLIRVLKRQE